MGKVETIKLKEAKEIGKKMFTIGYFVGIIAGFLGGFYFGG